MKAKFTELNSLEKLDELFSASSSNPVVLFKHSNSCEISSAVIDDVKQFDGEINLVVVQTARDISNEIAARTGIRHESPQALVIKKGQPVYAASHYDITVEDLEESLK